MKRIKHKIIELEQSKLELVNSKQKQNESNNDNLQYEIDTYSAFEVDHPSLGNPYYLESSTYDYENKTFEKVKKANSKIAELTNLLKFKEAYKEQFSKAIDKYGDSFILVIIEASADVFIEQMIDQDDDNNFNEAIKNAFFDSLLNGKISQMDIDFTDQTVLFDKNPKVYKCKNNESLMKLISRVLDENIEKENLNKTISKLLLDYKYSRDEIQP